MLWLSYGSTLLSLAWSHVTASRHGIAPSSIRRTWARPRFTPYPWRRATDRRLGPDQRRVHPEALGQAGRPPDAKVPVRGRPHLAGARGARAQHHATLEGQWASSQAQPCPEEWKAGTAQGFEPSAAPQGFHGKAGTAQGNARRGEEARCSAPGFQETISSTVPILTDSQPRAAHAQAALSGPANSDDATAGLEPRRRGCSIDLL